MMIRLEDLELGLFEPLVGQEFVVSGNRGTVKLQLFQVRQLGHRRPEAKRDPFSLEFRGPQGMRLPQGIYRFEHEALGALEFFITQVGDGGMGSEFEGVFT